jgi:long-chain acyl-CoA synthetase
MLCHDVAGEVCLSGASIAKGYYNLPSLTDENFTVDPVTGKRWFRTGDIGEFDENGKLTIIDRKKDLVKLQHGEYVSLGMYSALKATLFQIAAQHY